MFHFLVTHICSGAAMGLVLKAVTLVRCVVLNIDKKVEASAYWKNWLSSTYYLKSQTKTGIGFSLSYLKNR